MNMYLMSMFRGIYRFFTNPNERKLFLLSLFLCRKKRFERTTVNFSGYKLVVPDCLSFLWQFKEIFVDEFYKFSSQSKSPLIIDCGANIGTSCLYFKKLYPDSKIVAFEPNPEIARILKENLNLNKLDDIEVIDKAVWINDDGIDLGLEDADASSIYKKNNIIKVDSVRLKNFIERCEHIDMLKMDIEGAETEVIKDCDDSLKKIDNIFIEYHSFINNEQELDTILNILRKNNFRYFIKQGQDRPQPLVNHINKNFPYMDLQLNIFAYK